MFLCGCPVDSHAYKVAVEGGKVLANSPGNPGSWPSMATPVNFLQVGWGPQMRTELEWRRCRGVAAALRLNWKG